jgi:hypothetical protein
MATYVNNLRLKEITTGDESGTWGASTNTNLELIGEALGYGTEAITTNADTHASTVADGSTDEARAMYVKYTGTLDSTCTITIGPNTMKRVQFIENATSGSQSIIIKQGSGATVTIANGAMKVVYLDGAGSGAAVQDALVDLDLTGTTTAVNITASGTVTTANVTISGIVSAADGSAGAPSITNTGDTDTGIFFSAADTIAFTVGGTSQITLADGALAPVSDNDVDLGTSSLEFKDAYFDGTVNADAIVSDQINVEGQGDVRWEDSSGGEYVAIQAPSTVSSSYTFTLPAADGSSGQVLKTDGSGNLGFVSINTPGAAASFTQVDVTSQGDVRYQDSSGGQYVALQAPATVSSSYTLTLPAADGSSGQSLVTDGSGALSFSSASGTTPVSGFFEISATDNTTYSKSGLSFQPSLIVFRAVGGATVGSGEYPYFCTSDGFATGTGSNQSTVSSRVMDKDNLGASVVEYGVVKNDNYCYWINNYDGAFNFGSVTAIASDGFTVTSSVANGVTAVLMYTAYP